MALLIIHMPVTLLHRLIYTVAAVSMWMVQTPNAYIVLTLYGVVWLLWGARGMSGLCRPMYVSCCLNVRTSSMYGNHRIDRLPVRRPRL
jgi:hypothetical protein